MKMKGMGLGTPLDPFAPGDLGPMDLDGELPQAIHERQEAAAQADGAGFGPMMGGGAAPLAQAVTSLIRRQDEELTNLRQRLDDQSRDHEETKTVLMQLQSSEAQTRGQLHMLEQKAALFESEAVKIVSACRGYEAALHSLAAQQRETQSQMAALARNQLAQNWRHTALSKAVQSAGPHAKPDDIVQRAETFYRFLAQSDDTQRDDKGDAVPPLPPVSGLAPAPEEELPPGEDSDKPKLRIGPVARFATLGDIN